MLLAKHVYQPVVNCFQNCIFDISNTAGYIQYAVFQEFESKIRIEKVFE